MERERRARCGIDAAAAGATRGARARASRPDAPRLELPHGGQILPVIVVPPNLLRPQLRRVQRDVRRPAVVHLRVHLLGRGLRRHDARRRARPRARPRLRSARSPDALLSLAAADRSPPARSVVDGEHPVRVRALPPLADSGRGRVWNFVKRARRDAGRKTSSETSPRGRLRSRARGRGRRSLAKVTTGRVARQRARVVSSGAEARGMREPGKIPVTGFVRVRRSIAISVHSRLV